jgi:hypothetical protein
MFVQNSMEGAVNQPESEPVPPLPLTKEAIMALNNYSVTFENACSLFNGNFSNSATCTLLMSLFLVYYIYNILFTITL